MSEKSTAWLTERLESLKRNPVTASEYWTLLDDCKAELAKQAEAIEQLRSPLQQEYARVMRLAAESETRAIRAGELAQQNAKQAERVEWRCFHCDEVFTDRTEAEVHFGPNEHAPTACRITPAEVAEYREAEASLRKHLADETTAVENELAAFKSSVDQQLRRAEENGYARGLGDAKKHPEELGLVQAERVAALEKMARECFVELNGWGELYDDAATIELVIKMEQELAAVLGDSTDHIRDQTNSDDL